MGYTHSWYRTETIDVPVWIRLTTDVGKLIEHSPVPLVGDCTEPGSLPESDVSRILFNGANGNGFENFHCPRIHLPRPGRPPPRDGLWFSSCKTGWRPYDLLVTATLLVLKHHLGDGIRVHSDSGQTQWSGPASASSGLPGAIPFCWQVLGYGAECRITESGELL